MDGSKRFALSMLVGFAWLVLAFPVSCTGLVLWNEHRYGDVEANGPFAFLGGLAVAAFSALLVALLTWRKLRSR